MASLPLPLLLVEAGVEQKSHTDWSKLDSMEKDEDSEGSTHISADDPEDDGISTSSSDASLPWDRIVCFADEIANGVLEEIVEVESFKEYCKFTNEDKVQAEKEWCERLFERMDSDEGGITCLKGVVIELAVSAHGNEVVQYALEAARGEEQTMLLSEMRGSICHLASSLYGAEVLQTCLEAMRPAAVSFIATELLGYAADAARSESGQAVLCRIFEHLPAKYTAPLCEELWMSVLELCIHPYASQVVSHLMDYSSRPHQVRVCEIIATHEQVLSKHRLAVPLLRKARHYLQAKAT